MRAPVPALLLAACAADPGGAVGAFTIEVAREPLGLTIRHPSGLALHTAPGAFAVRDADAAFEMSFGAFKIEELPAGDFVAADRLEEAGVVDGVFTARLFAGEVELGALRAEGRGESLVLSLGAATANRARLALVADDGAFWGFGAQTHDVDHRGQRVPIWVSEQGIGKVDGDDPGPAWFLLGTRHQSYLPIPAVVAPRAGASYGLSLLSHHRSIWDVAKTDPGVLSIEVWSGELALVVSPGPSPSDVLDQATEVSGRIPTPPDWTFGVWMEAIGGEAAVLAEADRLAAAGIPASAIWTEDWRGGVRLGNDYALEEDWRADPALYPDLTRLASALAERGLRFMTYFNTFVAEDRDVWAETRAAGLLVKDRLGADLLFDGVDGRRSGLVELFLPAAREFTIGELGAALDAGVDGWMADFAEWYPADRRAVAPADGSDPEAAHQRYPVEWAKVNREAVARSGRSDVVIFHRSGSVGSQAHAHVVWAGDQRTSFEPDDGLPTVVPILIGLGVTGFPITTHDIGGYMSATNPPTTKELFFRWTSLGALAPVMRTHHGRGAFANWRWDSDPETRAHFGRWAALHTRLFPLFAGLALDARDRGLPITRPLGFHDPGRRELHAVKDAFLVGPSLLVAPVLTASTTAREVVFPPGRWVGLLPPHAWIEGGAARAVEAPLTELPLFVRAGGIVPMFDEVPSTLATDSAALRAAKARRRLFVALGAAGEARDASGGRFVLASPRSPAAIARVEGATVRELAEGVATVSASSAAPFELVEEDGTRHRLALEGAGAEIALEVELRW